MKVQMADHVIWRDLGDEVVILSLANNNYFGLVGAGGQMWRHLAENGSTDLTVDALRKEFDTDIATLRNDLQVLVRELEALGLVVVGNDGAKQSPDKAKAPGVSRIKRAPRRVVVKRRAAKPAAAGKRASKTAAPKKRAAQKRRSKKTKR
ncbi:MAG TPA: PqqD family protein [Candidatus Acidoferrales bacterium]|nr:PqqD family protein [Candidatus Acidoferrales bacterium]